MALTLRTAEPDDLDRLIELNQLCYPLLKITPEERGELFYKNNARCTLDDVYVVVDGGDLIASMIAYRFDQYQDEAALPIVGIGAVAVSPQRRREGVAGFMIEQSLKRFEEESVPACILYPFEHRFYRPQGWGYAGEIRQYQILTSQLCDFEWVKDDKDISTGFLREGDLTQLIKFYDAQARRSNGLLKRVERYWLERVIAPPRQVVAARFKGDIVGYMIFSMKETIPGNFLVQAMEVHELMAPTLDARDALLGFLSFQEDQVRSVHLTLPPDEPLHLWVDDPRDINRKLLHQIYHQTSTVGLGWMYRLVNLKAAFESGRKFNNVKGDLTIEMEDDLLGNRRLIIHFTGKGAEISKTDSSSDRVIAGPVDLLSQLFCGYTSARQAFQFDLLDFEGKDTVEFCQRVFDLPPPRCFDMF